MSDAVIRLDRISKQYRIIAAQRRIGTLREAIMDGVSRMGEGVGRLLSGRRGILDRDEEVWALQDISLEVKRGEVVGLIGRNGSGKSTLLKILSRITEPTTGYGEITGRVGSLLEVGTGFHPELSGRDNVFLNGAILGMKRAEIQSKFDEIVAFAEVEKFIDTPVKRYSSGMHMRLAFAVAAHLDPEILMVDEVLAVGDARFQKRCLSKMQDVGQRGRTVIFVSHNMQTITRLCARAILLDSGVLREDGPAPRVVGTYLNSEIAAGAARTWPDTATAPGDDWVRLRTVRVCNEDGEVIEHVDVQRPVGIEIEYEVLRPECLLMVYFHLYNEVGIKVIEVVDLDPAWRGRPRPRGRYVTTGWIPGNLLAEGRHYVEVGAATLEPLTYRFNERDAVAFQTIDSLDGGSTRGDWGGPMDGAVRPLLRWTTRFAEDGTKSAQTAARQA